MNSTGQIKLFIVEDNFMYSYVLEEVLKEYGNFKISSFTTGEKCLELLDSNPDVIILDYNLDDSMNGADTFKVIHSRKPKTPVIILSSQQNIQVAADLLKQGVFAYIEKKDNETAMQKLKDSIIKALKSN
jgi:two-component system OmpR family response regulator